MTETEFHREVLARVACIKKATLRYLEGRNRNVGVVMALRATILIIESELEHLTISETFPPASTETLRLLEKGMQIGTRTMCYRVINQAYDQLKEYGVISRNEHIPLSSVERTLKALADADRGQSPARPPHTPD